MTSYVASADGTRIAFERLGDGPPLIVVGGLLCDRRKTHELAEALARTFDVVNFDRRGRGESSDTPPYAVAREVEDIGALIAEVGGKAFVYGHSSGAALALRAAAGGLPITRLVLHEPPYGGDDEESRQGAKDLAEVVRNAIESGRPAQAIEAFFGSTGMPQDAIDELSQDARLIGMAPTMPYDHEVVGDFERGGTVPEDLVRAINIPTLVVVGTDSPNFFRDVAVRIAQMLLHGRLAQVHGDHGAPADVVAPVVVDFLATASVAG